MSKVKRVYSEKMPEFAVKAKELSEEISSYLNINTVTNVRVLIRYDIENITKETYEKALVTVFSEPPVDYVYEEDFTHNDNEHVFGVEFLPGQFDQRADSAVQCIKLLKEDEEPVIKTAVIYAIEGSLTEDELDRIKNFCINPVDSREADIEKPETLVTVFPEPADVIVFDGFKDMDEDRLHDLYSSLGLAMTFKDFLHIQNYFKNEEHRDPSMTEIRVLDTYWSDHCRHTTFSTELKNIEFEDGYYKEPIEKAFEDYKNTFADVYAGRDDKFVCLMDIALLAMKKLKKEGKLDDMEVSDEINACSIVVPVEIDGKTEEWLVNFKNETHNHPTEIEPFGGAATCLGGAIRDPLSGRTYVYQAMRVTGAADPTLSLDKTMAGKLPQKKIVREAAHGYSSYGNQIGLATGYVKEIYHPNYAAKRMEIGAVMGAAPRKDVIRETSDPGDIIILLGGRTGRDGCGGATGSSKAHTEKSIDTCGAEVQKGNAPTERKIQRLFRRPEVSKLIKKCNDFGAGGVSVAIGELADGLKVSLDKVPKKYAGLDGTELAISESQERMAVVVDPKDVKDFLKYANEENLEAVEVAVVTEEKRLVLTWRGKDIVNISRAFLDTNGAHQETDVVVEMPSEKDNLFNTKPVTDVKAEWLKTLSDLNVCSQKGLVEMFDGSIGAGSVYMPYGGKYQLTEVQTMVAKLPVLKGKTDMVTMMSYGFDPYLSSWSAYHGAIYAVVESMAKIVCAGGDYRKIRFTFQEYFRRMTEDKTRWGEPMKALLGAFEAQMGFGLPSIGGKDSMSGTFEDIDVPPTLVSFAVAMTKASKTISTEFKNAGSKVIFVPVPENKETLMPVWDKLIEMYNAVYALCEDGKVLSASVVKEGGTAASVCKACFGNGFGFKFANELTNDELFAPLSGSLVIELADGAELSNDVLHYDLGTVTNDAKITVNGKEIELSALLEKWTAPLEKVFPTKAEVPEIEVDVPLYSERNTSSPAIKVAKPTVFIPVFPGTNCEVDTARAFEKAGANVEMLIVKNLSSNDIEETIDEMEKLIAKSQMIMLPGGFSGGDEPDGSGKFIATTFRNPRIAEQVNNLLKNRDGLMLGICNGFQALIKLGLVPYGEIRELKANDPTLTFNTIGRHISHMAYTRVTSVKSPWFANVNAGDVFAVPVSHGEGRFMADVETVKELAKNGQIATQYVDLAGNPSSDIEFNLNGSVCAIEGITSPDGRVLGKMGHSERKGENLYKNVPFAKDQQIFESGVKYFK